MTSTPGKPAKSGPKPEPTANEDPYLRAARKFPALKAQAAERLLRRTDARASAGGSR